MSSAPYGDRSQSGRYAVYDAIASGGMATVHFGLLRGASGFKRVVAVKKLHPQFAHDPDFVAMFLDEARMASRVRHPNVVATLDVVDDGAEVLLVMEYVAGETLAQLLRKGSGGPPPVDVAVAIALGVLHGLHAAHEATNDQGEPLELVHRDVSPQNVLVGSDGTVRVVDFGVAKATGRSQTTREGQLKGKMPYMAPEQLRSGQVGRRSDIWSASVVLWELLTGRRLFDGDSEGHIYSKIVNEKAPPPSTAAPAPLPPGLDAIVLQGLQRSPDRRYSTAREMASALEPCVTPATPAQVAAWVDAIAHDVLEKRARRLAAVERQASAGGPVTAASELAMQPPRSRPRRGMQLAVALLLVVVALPFVALRSPAAPASAEEGGLASLTSTVVSASDLGDDPPNAEATDPSATASASPPPTARGRFPTRPPRPVASSGPSRGDRCRFLDADGVWHVRPECL